MSVHFAYPSSRPHERDIPCGYWEHDPESYFPPQDRWTTLPDRVTCPSCYLYVMEYVL